MLKKLFLIIITSLIIFGAFIIYSKTKTDDTGIAQQTLITYFNLLNVGDYSQASLYHGSGYETLQNWNPDINPDDHAALLKNGCTQNGWQCLKIKNILHTKKLSDSEFEFIVQFAAPNETVFYPKTDFTYLVKKINNHFVVATPPIYVP